MIFKQKDEKLCIRASFIEELDFFEYGNEITYFSLRSSLNIGSFQIYELRAPKASLGLLFCFARGIRFVFQVAEKLKPSFFALVYEYSFHNVHTRLRVYANIVYIRI